MNAESLKATDVCAVEEVWPDTGVCARVGGRHVAVFRVVTPDGERWFGLDNVDPKSGASVLSRGLVGNLGNRLVVASPIYKNHFDLATGECLEEPAHSVRPWAVEVVDGRVQVLG